MQKKGKALSAKRQKIQSEAVAATLEYVQGISVVKSFNMCDKNLSDIEDAYESNAAASYGVERVFTPLNMTYHISTHQSTLSQLTLRKVFLYSECLDIFADKF